MSKEIVEFICDFWANNYLNLHEASNRNYKVSVWRYKIVALEADRVWMSEWEQPSASLPISRANGRVFFTFKPERNVLSVRYESQRLENEIDLSKLTTDGGKVDIQVQVKEIYDANLFNPLAQLSQIVASKHTVSQLLREEKWLAGCEIYKHDVTNASKFKTQMLLKDEVSQAMKALDHVPVKLIRRLESKYDKTIEFHQRLDKLNSL